MQENIKEQLVRSVDSIKKKLRDIRSKNDEHDLKVKKILKPLSDPLNHLIEMKNNKYESTVNKQNKYEKFEPKEYTRYHTEDESFDVESNVSSEKFEDTESILETSLNKDDFLNVCDNVNVPFGVRRVNSNLFMGSSKINLSLLDNPNSGDKIYSVIIDNNKQYELTPGLRELLLHNKPNLALVTEKDKVVYRNILHETNAHKRDFNPSGQINGNKSEKYRKIIKPMFCDIIPNIQKTGGALPSMKEYRRNTDLVYWDDPNELVDRLKILVASRQAGNNNHDNEIISIIEELKEANVIKE